jgi:multidrug efflux system outer membrane protein
MKQLISFTSAILFSSLIVLTGCKVGKNFEGNSLEIPDSLSATDSLISVNTDSLQALIIDGPSWWTLFEDPLLDTLVSKALRHNLSLEMAALNIEQARLALGISKNDLLPKFGYGVQLTSGNTLGGMVGPEQDFLFGGLQVSWEIDVWGKLRRRNEAARRQLLASEYGVRALQISLVTQVMETYFYLLQNKAQLEIAQRNAALRDSMQLIIQARFDKGYAPGIDLDQAKIQSAIAAGAVPVYKRAVAQASHALSVLIGEWPRLINSPNDLLSLHETQNLPERLPVELLNRRPDLLQKEQIFASQNALAGAAQGDRLPRLSLSGSFGTGTNDLGDLNFTDPLWQAGAGLVGPLFYWGQLKKRADIAKSKSQQAQLDYQFAQLQAVREVKDYSVALQTFEEQMTILEKRVEAALHAQTLSQARYNQGVTSYLEYLESQRQAFDAELALMQVAASRLNAYTGLYKALGGGWLDKSEQTQKE